MGEEEQQGGGRSEKRSQRLVERRETKDVI